MAKPVYTVVVKELPSHMLDELLEWMLVEWGNLPDYVEIIADRDRSETL